MDLPKSCAGRLSGETPLLASRLCRREEKRLEPVRRSTQCRSVLNLRAHTKRVDVVFSNERCVRAGALIRRLHLRSAEFNIRDNRCFDLTLAMNKGDRLHAHIRQLHRCGSVRKTMANAHDQVVPRHWCFRRRRRRCQSLPQSRHPSPWPWPWPLGQIGIGKTTATQTQTSSGRRQGPIPGARPCPPTCHDWH